MTKLGGPEWIRQRIVARDSIDAAGHWLTSSEQQIPPEERVARAHANAAIAQAAASLALVELVRELQHDLADLRRTLRRC